MIHNLIIVTADDTLYICTQECTNSTGDDDVIMVG